MTTAPRFKRLRAVTESVLKMKPNQTRYILIGTPMYQGKKVDAKKEAGILVRALDMETGEEGLVFCGAVLSSELFREYGGAKAEYVGKGFELTMTKQQDRSSEEKGSAYNHYSISEVSVPEDVKPPTFEQPAKDAVALANKRLSEQQAARDAAAKAK